MPKLYRYPRPSSWNKLCERPASQTKDLLPAVQTILDSVRAQGDTAVLNWTEKFDGIRPAKLAVPAAEISRAAAKLDPALRAAIRQAYRQIRLFHRSQCQPEPVVETAPGVRCWRRSLPIEKVGLYIPGGSAPLFSSVLMLAIPARLAGCEDIILCTPPGRDGSIHPAILFAASLCGIRRIYRAGGAQAIAAMAYGTRQIPRVDKIFGPGNAYVTLAKQLVQQQGVAIDMPAGPSELLVIADETATAAFVAADLLSQAEHGPDSQVVLVTTAPELPEAVQLELDRQLALLPRGDLARTALSKSHLILVRNLEEAMAFSNLYAPEHLILACRQPQRLAARVRHAGSVFLGHFAPESAGDYASGTNHTLPTQGYARQYSGVSVDSFVKKITFQQLERKGLQRIGPAVMAMAAAEGLEAHRQAVAIRLNAP